MISLPVARQLNTVKHSFVTMNSNSMPIIRRQSTLELVFLHLVLLIYVV